MKTNPLRSASLSASQPVAHLGNAREASTGRRGAKVWVWIFAVICVQLAAWTAWFVVASRHKVEEVPLASEGK